MDSLYISLSENYSEFLWSVFSRIRTKYGEILFSVFGPNAGKYRPEKLRIRILFTQCYLSQIQIDYSQILDDVLDDVTSLQIIVQIKVSAWYNFIPHHTVINLHYFDK